MNQLAAFWPEFVAAMNVTLALWAAGHAVLSKRDTRAAIGWGGVIWLAPFLGAMLYAWLGINRIERRARSLRANRRRLEAFARHDECPAVTLDQTLAPDGAHLKQIVNLVREVTRRPLLAGNHVAPLINGDQAYPAMLQAIDEAAHSVSLSTYIFAHDRTGQSFLAALQRAMSRGVDVRVLIDDVGARHSWRPMPRVLRDAGIPCAQFLPTVIPWRFQYSNLRSHRKILVVDGQLGFTGGMDLYQGNCMEQQPDHRVQDLHFRFTGPVVAQLQDVFAEDWAFCTGEILEGDRWFPPAAAEGAVLARGVPNGPDDDFETLRLALLGAIACARSSVLIVTPYFLPDASLVAALNVAALRGIQGEIVLPADNELALVNWASMALIWQVLERGCRVWLSPPPFDHTNLMLVDGLWTFLGSANWDPRSLRLNFEFNVECYDRGLASFLTDLVRSKIEHSRPLTLDEVDRRRLHVKLRDGIARLFSPYL